MRAYLVRYEDEPNFDDRQIPGLEECDAAEAWIEKQERDTDRPIANGAIRRVVVRDIKTGKETSFDVSGWWSPNYHASEVEDESEDE